MLTEENDLLNKELSELLEEFVQSKNLTPIMDTLIPKVKTFLGKVLKRDDVDESSGTTIQRVITGSHTFAT